MIAGLPAPLRRCSKVPAVPLAMKVGGWSRALHGSRDAAIFAVRLLQRRLLPELRPAARGALICSRRSLAAAAAAGTSGRGAGLSPTANSFISMGAFESMGTDTGRAATGLAYLEESLRLQEEQVNAETDPRRRAIRGLGLCQHLLQVGRHHHQQEDPAEAIVHYERGVKLIEDALQAQGAREGVESSSRSVNYARFSLSEFCSGLAVSKNDLGETEEALELMQKALKLRKETVGKNHPSLAECYNNLGAIYQQRGALQKAVEHFEQALDLLTAAVEGRQEGPHCALTLYNIGVCQIGLGHMQQGIQKLRDSHKIAEQALGSDHPQVAFIKSTIDGGGKSPA